MESQNLRYIVFLLNPDVAQFLSDGRRIDTHDGNIYCNLQDAKEYAQECIKDKDCTRFAIGVFVLDKEAERMEISHIETFGFRNDKKNVNQLELFSQLPEPDKRKHY
jgi:hypothetical protein